MNSKWKKWLTSWEVKTFLAALIIRLVVGGLFYHTDTKALYRDAAWMNQGIKAGYEQAFAKDSPLFYPPATYLAFNWYQKTFQPIFSDYYQQWMSDWGSLHTVKHPAIFQDLLAMKLPFLLADLLVAVGLMQVFKEREKKRLAAVLWLFNPVSIYAIYVIGQFDVWPALLVLAGLLAWKRKRWTSYLLVGLAGTLKLYPLMLLPVMWLLDDDAWWRRIMKLGLGGGVLAASLLPVASSAIARSSILGYNLNRGMFAAGWEIGGNEFLSLYMIWYVTVLFLAWRGKLAKNLNLAIVLLWSGVFGLSHFHPQWIVWLLPFLLILAIRKKASWSNLLLAAVGYGGTVALINDRFISWGSLKAINNAFDTLEPIRYWFDRLGIGGRLQDFFHSVLLVSLVVIGLQGLKMIDRREFLRGFKIKGWQKAGKWLIGWTVGLIGIFLLAHVPLAGRGAYLGHEKMNPNAVVRIILGDKLSQPIKVENDGFNSLQLRAKNINLQFEGKVKFELWEKDKLLREVEIPGQVIKDDYDLWVKFVGIEDSAGKQYRLVTYLTSDPSKTGLVFGYQEGKEGLRKSGEKIEGLLSYRTFYNPGSYRQNLQYSLNNIKEKLF